MNLIHKIRKHGYIILFLLLSSGLIFGLYQSYSSYLASNNKIAQQKAKIAQLKKIPIEKKSSNSYLFTTPLADANVFIYGLLSKDEYEVTNNDNNLFMVEESEYESYLVLENVVHCKSDYMSFLGMLNEMQWSSIVNNLNKVSFIAASPKPKIIIEIESLVYQTKEV